MKILTTVKRVTDPEMKVKIKADGSGISTDGVEFKMNSFDEYSIAEAATLKKAHGGEILVVSIGPEASTKEMRTAMGMGADRGILVQTDETVDSDAVARILAEVCKRENPDLVLMGKQAIDSDRNQTGQLLSAYMDWPQATFAYSIAVSDGFADVGREVDGGTSTKRVQLPAIITADLRLNTPPLVPLPMLMKAKRKPLEIITPEDLGVDITPKVKAVGFEAPEARAAGQIVESVDALIEKLKNEAKVL